MRKKGINGALYLILFIDDYSRMTWVSILKKKYEAFESFKVFKQVVENETKMRINFLSFNDGVEFTLNELKSFVKKRNQKKILNN